MMSMSPEKQSNTVAVIGGGITGLVAAWKLAGQGVEPALYEASSRFGGSIQTECKEGWLIEAGPNSLLDGDPELQTLIDELGLRQDLLQASEGAKKRFIVRDGRLQALPMSPPSFLTTRLFSLGMKYRIFAEMRQKPRQREQDVSLEQFIREHFGQEAVDYGLNPFVSGVYAGDPAQLSAKHSFPALWEIERQHGSILKGQMAAAKARKARGGSRPKIVSFRNGLQTLVDRLQAKLPTTSLRAGHAVTRLTREGTHWYVEGTREGQYFRDSAKAVILALPAHALAQLKFGSGDESPLARLSEIIHPPVTSLFLGYRREQVVHPLDGFGALIPALENRRELGILFSSSLFEGRAPEGHVALTVMVGGMRQPEIARRTPTEILNTVRTDLVDLLGVRGDPVFQRCTQWCKAIPQYNLGYQAYLQLIQACEQANPGLYIGGNARDGISVPNCIKSGLRLAHESS